MAREEAWTDERLDDLKSGMHREFDQVRREFDQVHGELDQVHGEIRDLRSEMREGFDSVNARVDSLQLTMIGGFAAIVASVVATGIL